MKWRSVKVADALVQRIERIAPSLGYASVAQFIGEAIRKHLVPREREYDEIEQDRELGRKIRTET